MYTSCIHNVVRTNVYTNMDKNNFVLIELFNLIFFCILLYIHTHIGNNKKIYNVDAI